jgi:hypothetical protein
MSFAMYEVIMKLHNGMLCFLLMYSQLCARLEVLDIDPKNVELLSTQEMRFCYISFVKINGKKYLIKQKKSDYFRKIVSVVRDAITAHIAESFGIAHQVDVIPAGKVFPGKPRADWPATIHTIAPGKMIKAQNSYYRKMKIQQKEGGFRRDMLEWMSKHPELVIIVALDIFVCNHDRHRGNLFYNAKTNSFCAIDMDSAYKYNLSEIACKNFLIMLNDKKLRLNNKEIYTLMQFRKQLQFLIDSYFPTDIVRMYDYFAHKAGFVEGSALYTDRIAVELMANRAMIFQSYQDAKRLIKIVGKLVKKHQNAKMMNFSVKK